MVTTVVDINISISVVTLEANDLKVSIIQLLTPCHPLTLWL